MVGNSRFVEKNVWAREELRPGSESDSCTIVVSDGSLDVVNDDGTIKVIRIGVVVNPVNDAPWLYVGNQNGIEGGVEGVLGAGEHYLVAAVKVDAGGVFDSQGRQHLGGKFSLVDLQVAPCGIEDCLP